MLSQDSQREQKEPFKFSIPTTFVIVQLGFEGDTYDLYFSSDTTRNVRPSLRAQIQFIGLFALLFADRKSNFGDLRFTLYRIPQSNLFCLKYLGFALFQDLLI